MAGLSLIDLEILSIGLCDDSEDNLGKWGLLGFSQDIGDGVWAIWTVSDGNDVRS